MSEVALDNRLYKPGVWVQAIDDEIAAAEKAVKPLPEPVPKTTDDDAEELFK